MARPSKMHRVYPGGPFRTTIKGKTYLLGKDERKARAMFLRLQARELDQPTGTPEYVADLVTAWIRINDKPCYRYWLQPFVEHAGATHVDDVGVDLLTRYLVHLKAATDKRIKEGEPRPLSAETIRHLMRTAGSVLTWAHRQRWIRELPDTPKLAKAVRKARDIEIPRLREILGKLPEYVRPIVRFIASTGCRPGEACNLQWRDVHLDAGVCILGEHKTASKTGKSRTVYLTPEAADVLRKMTPTTGHVFLNRSGNPHRVNGLYLVLQRKAGINTYQLRHTFAQVASEKLSEQDLAKLLGHTDTRMTRHYFEVRDKRAIGVAKTIRLRMGKTA